MEICPFDFEGFSSLHLIWVAVSDAPSSDWYPDLMTMS
jgi:hypothetical protein